MGRNTFVPAEPPVDILADVLGGPRGHVAAELPVDKINTTGGTQMRAGLDDSTVFDYGQAMIAANGWGTFPAVITYYDGKNYWLADGFHRVAAFLESFPDHKRTIPVEVRAGTRRDAVLHAAGANAQHGLRRTNQDKRRAVETLLRDEEWAAWSDGTIAKACAVSDRFVSSIRKELSPNGSEMIQRLVTRNGTTYTQNTAKIGSRPAPQPTPAPVLNTAPAKQVSVVTLDDLPVVDSVTVPARTQAEIDVAINEEIELVKTHFRNGVEARREEDEQIVHPLDCYEDEDDSDAAILGRLKWPMKMRDCHELKMWLKTTRDEKAREYTKLTGQTVPTWFTEGLDHMIATLETTMDAVEQEAVASVAA